MTPLRYLVCRPYVFHEPSNWCEQAQDSPSQPYRMYSQENILMSLVQGQEGRAWAMNLKGWKNDDIYVCDWDYIVCDAYKTTVTGIQMSQADFYGTLPTELGMLVTLEEISMRRNLIIGKIPREIANLPHLEKIFLAENRLTGTVPYFSSYKLKTIDMAYNRFTGTLDPNLVRLNPQLRQLDLASNNIEGTIPISFENAEKLLTLSLSQNQLTGTIHDFFGRKPSLNYLYLDGNFIMGTIPQAFSGKSSNLRELWLQDNQLTGTIPPEIGTISDLFNFYIDGNKLTGSVPSSLCRPELNADFFQATINNEDRDFCESIACPPSKVSLEGVYPCEQCADTYFNPYLGRVDECIDLVELDIFSILYKSTGGFIWSDWDMQGTSYCDLEGITCGNNGNIIGIDLKGKGLHGTIPEEIGFLRHLERLDLSDNYLVGYLPSDLRWAPLQFLDVSGNRIKGIIPKSLCRKEGINGNGNNGEFDCDLIQCSPHYYSPDGRSTEKHKCKPCPHGKGIPFIGGKKCLKLFSTSKYKVTDENVGPVVRSFFLFFLFLSFAIICARSSEEHKHKPLVSTDDQDDKQSDASKVRLGERVVLT